MFALLGFIILFVLSLVYLYFKSVSIIFESKKMRIITTIILALCGTSIVFGVLLTRNYESSNILIPKIVSFLSGFYLLLFSLFMAKDVFYLPLVLIEKRVDIELQMAKFLGSRAITFFMIPLCLITAGVGVYEGTKVPEVKNVTIEFDNLPPSLHGFTLVQLTDLHTGTGSNGAWLQKVVTKVNELNADMIVLTGDIVDHSPEVLATDMIQLAGLHAPYGEYFILGNHEYYTHTVEWIEYFKKLGTPLLINETKLVEVGEAHIAVTGLADLAGNRPEFVEAGLSVDHEKAIQSVPHEIFHSPDTFNLLLMHQPKGASENAEYGYDLQLSGHTHGGQVFLLFRPVAWANDGFRLGLYEVGEMLLYVSSGTSQWGYWSMRLGAPTEITLITLKNKN